MNHFISICSSRGAYAPHSKKVVFEKIFPLLCSPKIASEKKENSILIFNGYSSMLSTYARRESEVDRFSTIFLDVDNEEKNPNIIDDFKKEFQQFDFYLYETFSSTKEHPKFRAIILLDEELTWSKSAKKAIFKTFKHYADEKASWFFSPTKNKLGTVHHNEGKLYPASKLKEKIEEEERRERMKRTNQIIKQFQINTWMKNNNIEKKLSWRNLPSVKHCLDGLVVGERDSSINSACYALLKNGYKDFIHEFLSEVSCDSSILSKFAKRYR